MEELILKSNKIENISLDYDKFTNKLYLDNDNTDEHEEIDLSKYILRKHD